LSIIRIKARTAGGGDSERITPKFRIEAFQELRTDGLTKEEGGKKRYYKTRACCLRDEKPRNSGKISDAGCARGW